MSFGNQLVSALPPGQLSFGGYDASGLAAQGIDSFVNSPQGQEWMRAFSSLTGTPGSTNTSNWQQALGSLTGSPVTANGTQGWNQALSALTSGNSVPNWTQAMGMFGR